MRVIVAGESDTAVKPIEQALLREKLCPELVHTLPLQGIGDRLPQLRPDVVILSLPQQLEQILPLVRDLRETSPARLLAVGPTAEAKLILDLLKEGITQYIDQDEMAQGLKAALQRLSETPVQPSSFGNLIAVIGAGGGNGASTLVVNMGVALKECAVIDLRLECGDLAALLNLCPPHSLADFCRNVERMDSLLFESCLERHSSGLWLLAAPSTPRDVTAVHPRGIRKAIGMARCRFPYVLADLDFPARRDQAQILYHADLILIVIRMDFTSIRQAQRLLMHLDELQLDRERVRLIVSRYRRPRELRLDAVRKIFQRDMDHFVPDDPKRVNRANNQGIPVICEFPRAKVSRSYQEISRSVNGKVCGKSRV
jgi:pilus assembly protein CpaE